MAALMRRSMLAGTGGGVAAAIAACSPVGGGTGGQSAGGSKLAGTFEFWQPWPIEQPTHGGPRGWKQLMDAYNAKGGPRANISTPAGNLNDAVQTAFAAGSPPDSWQVDQLWTVVYGAKGFSAPLDDLIKRDKWDKGQIFNAAFDTMSWSGKVWAMMQHPDIVFNWLSVSLMEENGVPRTIPTNWTQLDELMIRLTKKTGADSFEFIGGIPHIWNGWQVVLPQANGAKLVSDDGRKAQLDSPEVMRPSSGPRATSSAWAALT